MENIHDRASVYVNSLPRCSLLRKHIGKTSQRLTQATMVVAEGLVPSAHRAIANIYAESTRILGIILRTIYMYIPRYS